MSNLMVVHLMDVRSYACLVDGCLLTVCGDVSCYYVVVMRMAAEFVDVVVVIVEEEEVGMSVM